MAENVDEMQERGKAFGVPWPDLNDGLTYSDFVRPLDSGSTLIQFYSSKHNNSAPLQGWLQRIQNGQITLDGQVVTDPDTILRDGSELLYCRLPWKEPCAPYLLEVLFEDDDMVALNKPSGLQVLPGGLFQQRTVLTQLQLRAKKPNSSRAAAQKSHPVPVHRLGRGTSVKVLNLQRQGASKSLVAECKVLRNVRHRNLLKVLTVCSSIDSKGNDFKALVFDYTANGNLEQWLHPSMDKQHQPKYLSLTQRLNTVVDVALALNYLHTSCKKPIVHCDLKPNNIFLDDDMNAHVGDLGLTRFLSEGASSCSQNHTNSPDIKEYGMGGGVSTFGDI